MHLISLAALVLTATPPATANAEAAPRPTIVAQTATTATVRRKKYEPAGMVVQGGTSSDQDAIAEQQALHVLMPALSGDGGG